MNRWKNIIITCIYLPIILFTFCWWSDRSNSRLQEFHSYLKEKNFNSIILDGKIEFFIENKEDLENLLRLNLYVEQIEKLDKKFYCVCVPEEDRPRFVLKKRLVDSRCIFLGKEYVK